MSKKRKKLPLGQFMACFKTERDCRDFLATLRWSNGFVCPKCGHTHAYVLSNGLRQCTECGHQSSVTAGTVMHRSHVPLKKWFLAFYFATQDKRGVSATYLSAIVGLTYKTAYYMLARIRTAMGQRDAAHMLSGDVEFDDAYFGGAKEGGKRGRGTAKAKVFIALSRSVSGHPQYLKMQVTQDLTQKSVKQFANQAIEKGSTVHTDGYSSYIPALKEYDHQHKPYDPRDGMLHWLHIMTGNAKAYILGTYHGLPTANLQSYLNEFAYRFNRRNFGGDLVYRLMIAVVSSSRISFAGISCK